MGYRILCLVEEGNSLYVEQLKTNKGNQISVGNPEQREWSVRHAPEGEQLIGLVLAFAPRIGTQVSMARENPDCNMYP